MVMGIRQSIYSYVLALSTFATATTPLYVLALSTFAAATTPLYHLDTTFHPKFPLGSNTFSAVGVYRDSLFVTQRGNATLPPVLHLSTQTGAFVSSWGEHDVALAKPGNTWGAHGLSIEDCHYPCADGSSHQPFVRVWIEDFTNHTMTAFSFEGQKLLQLGTPGQNGTGTDPIQFGNVADAFVQAGLVTPSPGPTETSSHIYASDGDGGSANRVIKINVPPRQNQGGKKAFTEWATDSVFDNPHSITLHRPSQLLIVADREQFALKLLEATNGTVLGTFNCGLTFGKGHGVPFGVRTLVFGGKDLLFVAAMDNPQDHKHQKIFVLDVSGLNANEGVGSACRVVQTIEVDANEYSGPHLLGIDESNGDVYAALVADVPLSTVLRYRLN